MEHFGWKYPVRHVHTPSGDVHCGLVEPAPQLHAKNMVKNILIQATFFPEKQTQPITKRCASETKAITCFLN